MIYKNITEAKCAISKFESEMAQLEDEYGIFYSSDDDCSDVYIHVEYYDQNGEVKTLTK